MIMDKVQQFSHQKLSEWSLTADKNFEKLHRPYTYKNTFLLWLSHTRFGSP